MTTILGFVFFCHYVSQLLQLPFQAARGYLSNSETMHVQSLAKNSHRDEL